ncbi:MAG TPA: CHAT domain-containing protein [Thermoanaerobaculia bacterium]|nr:CHAT domain-containing protein [Thermoanaerobaculia bacterium]
MSWRAFLSILVLLAAAVAASFALGASRESLRETTGAGLLVEEVGDGSSMAEAGIRAGDILLSWERPAAHGEPPARGPLRSFFDLQLMGLEQSSRAKVRVTGARLGRTLTWTLAEGEWRITVRPLMPPLLESGYAAGRRRLAAGEAGRAFAQWNQTAEAAAAAGQPVLAAWLWRQVASEALERQLWDEAERVLARGLALPLPAAVRARLLTFQAQAFDRQGELLQAEAALRAALAAQAGTPPGLALAADLDDLGWALIRRGDLDGAGAAFRRALALRLRLAPGSLLLAASYNKLGILHMERGDLAAAEEMFRRVVGLWESRGPHSLAMAAGLENLGLVTTYRGDLAAAAGLMRRAAALKQRLDPDSEHVGRSLLNQGMLQWRRGDLSSAQDLLTSALGLWRQLSPRSRDLAGVLTNLGLIALDRGELGLAERRFREALALWRELEPGTPTVAGTLNNLAMVARRQGDPVGAERLLREALALEEKAAPQGLAAALYLQNLGELAEDQGALEEAEGLMRRALSISSRLAPGSELEAKSWYGLGRLHRRAGRPAEAREAWMRGVAALEEQEAKLGGTEEIRSAWRGKHGGLYHDLLELLLEQGRADEAFQLSERYRARRLLALLAERDLLWREDLPAGLARERSRLAVEHDRIQAALAQLDAGAADARAQVELLGRQLRELRNRRAELADAILAASPRLASLQYPRPLDAAAAQAALAPGTILLAYAVGLRHSHLFVLERDGPLRVFLLPVGEDGLRDRILGFRHLLRQPAGGTRSRAALEERGQTLARDLLAPALPHIARADRILILADGPLHALPFAPLPVAGRPAASRFLVEWKPLHTAASATVYAELRKRRRPSGSRGASRAGLVIFGDPRNARDLDGRPLPPLPATRAESRALERLFPGARVFLGGDATEEALKAAGRSARYLHVASHAVTDEHLPLDSYLALSSPRRPRPGQDNGLLQAWEIFEQVRLDSDLVTLASCSTALGRELAGEGVLSLARAFQYAGARSVVASLWDVPDRSTSLLMQRFYAGLARGLAKDEALRRAQVALLKRPETSHPFHWAAHQLAGDWH